MFMYPLVNIPKTMMENHRFQWENPLFLWPCSSSQTVSHYQRVVHILSPFTNQLTQLTQLPFGKLT